MTRPLQRQIDELKIATSITVTDGTASDIGIASGSTVDKAIDSLAVALNMMKNNNGYLTVTVLNSSNSQPIGDVLVNGITDSEGNAVYTDEDGIAAGYASEGSQAISISGYADITDISSTIDIAKGNFHTLTLNATVRNFLKITSSQSVKFSGNVETVDVTVVGGGGGGGSGYYKSTMVGGGGGYCTVKSDVDFYPETFYAAIVGAGGTVSTYTGNNGGSSSFLGISAAGGGGGGRDAYYNPTSAASLGLGNGRGGYVYCTRGDEYSPTNYVEPVEGSVLGYSSFTDSVYYGGGGQGGYYYISDGDDHRGVNKTKTTYGGSAGYNNNTAGSNGFGGGGGARTSSDSSTYGSKGGSGCVAIRIHLKSAS